MSKKNRDYFPLSQISQPCDWLRLCKPRKDPIKYIEQYNNSEDKTEIRKDFLNMMSVMIAEGLKGEFDIANYDPITNTYDVSSLEKLEVIYIEVIPSKTKDLEKYKVKVLVKTKVNEKNYYKIRTVKFINVVQLGVFVDAF